MGQYMGPKREMQGIGDFTILKYVLPSIDGHYISQPMPTVEDLERHLDDSQIPGRVVLEEDPVMDEANPIDDMLYKAALNVVTGNSKYLRD